MNTLLASVCAAVMCCFIGWLLFKAVKCFIDNI